jgi:hypothetical protein
LEVVEEEVVSEATSPSEIASMGWLKRLPMPESCETVSASSSDAGVSDPSSSMRRNSGMTSSPFDVVLIFFLRMAGLPPHAARGGFSGRRRSIDLVKR